MSLQLLAEHNWLASRTEGSLPETTWRYTSVWKLSSDTELSYYKTSSNKNEEMLSLLPSLLLPSTWDRSLCPRRRGDFRMTATHSQSSAQCQRQSLLSIQSIRLKKKIWAALAFSSCKRWTLAPITSFAKCSSSSVKKKINKKGLYCQRNIQTWIWLVVLLFIYLSVLGAGYLVFFFKKNSGRTPKWYFEKCYNV